MLEKKIKKIIPSAKAPDIESLWPLVPGRVKQIIKAVAGEKGLEPRVLYSGRKIRCVVEARYEAMRRIRELKNESGEPSFSLTRIGKFLATDHSMVIYALGGRDRRKADPRYTANLKRKVA